MQSRNPRDILLTVIQDALTEVEPGRVIHETVTYHRLNSEGSPQEISGSRISVREQNSYMEEGQQIYVLGSGKASAAMGKALEEILGDAIRGGVIITPAGTTRDLEYIDLREGSHPVPDERSLLATEALLQTARKIPEGSL